MCRFMATGVHQQEAGGRPVGCRRWPRTQGSGCGAANARPPQQPDGPAWRAVVLTSGWARSPSVYVRVHTQRGAVQATALVQATTLGLVPSAASGGTTPPPKVGRQDAGFAPGGLESEAGVLDTARSEETRPMQQVSWGGPGTPRGALCWWEQGLLPGGGCPAAWGQVRSGRAPAERGAQGQGPGGKWKPKVPPLLHLEEGAPGGLPTVPRGRAGAQSQAGSSGGGGQCPGVTRGQRPPAS